MSDEIVVKVIRKMFPQTYSARVQTKYKGTDKDMFLPDEVRWAMAGEPVAWFNAFIDDEKVTFMKRIPKPVGWPET